MPRQTCVVLNGIWHCYMYSHLGILQCYLSSFLADAYFVAFPTGSFFHSFHNVVGAMKNRPSLFKLSVFYTWLRVAYEDFRADLVTAVQTASTRYTRMNNDETADRVNALPKARATYIHLFNLLCLFEYFIPSVQDYGIALKLQDTQLLRQKLFNMLSVFTMLRTRGSNMYSRALFIFLQQWRYWEKKQVCYFVNSHLVVTHRLSAQAFPDCFIRRIGS